jgi:hypothetical protein
MGRPFPADSAWRQHRERRQAGTAKNYDTTNVLYRTKSLTGCVRHRTHHWKERML